MNDYKEYVDQLACKGENEVFFNSGPVHAAIVMSRIFKYSNGTVRIFSGGFNGAVSNDEEYLSCLEGFLKKPTTKLVCIVEKDLTKTGAKIFKVLRKYNSKVEIYLTNARVKYANEVTKLNKFIHFAIGDNKMLRIETGIEDYIAQVNFGDEIQAKMYAVLFDSILESRKNEKIDLLKLENNNYSTIATA